MLRLLPLLIAVLIMVALFRSGWGYFIPGLIFAVWLARTLLSSGDEEESEAGELPSGEDDEDDEDGILDKIGKIFGDG